MELSRTERRECAKIVILCCLWYLISSTNNIVSKVLLSYFPFPMTLSMVQLLSITLYSKPAFQCLGIRHVSHFTKDYFWKFIIPLALGKFLAVVFAHVSVWRVPLSYAHTVKATMPLFTVILGRVLLQQSHSVQVYVSLVPIVLGVAVATVTELSFDMFGLASALLSTALFAILQLFSKQVMVDTGVHHLTLLHILGQYAFLLFLPVWLLSDFYRLVTDSNAAWLARVGETVALLVLDGALSWLQNIVAFTMLHLVSPLTYAVCNATKRVAVIGASLLLLANPVSPANVLGMLVALSGVLLYNRAKYREQRAARYTLPITAPGVNGLRAPVAGAGPAGSSPLLLASVPPIDWADKLQPVYSTPAPAHTPTARFAVLVS